MVKNKTKVKDFLYEQESYLIRGACFEVWKEFKGVFKESVIEKALIIALKNKKLKIETQKRIDLFSGRKGRRLCAGYYR